jgi:transposase
LTARDICVLTHNPEFQAITDRNSQLAFTKNYAAEKCGVSLNGKKFAAIYEISVGHVKKHIRAVRQQRDAARSSRGRAPCLTEDQKRQLVELLLSTDESG